MGNKSRYKSSSIFDMQFITSSISTTLVLLLLGLVVPLLQGILADVLGSWRWSWFIVLLGEIFMLYYALIGSRCGLQRNGCGTGFGH